MTRAELKQNAKNSLQGKYGEAIKIMLLTFLISFGVGIIAGAIDNEYDIITNIASIAVAALLTFGQISFYLKISRNEEVTYKELFSKTNLFWPYICISFLTGLFTLLWSFLFIIPGIIAAISYSMVYYIRLDNPELSAMEAIKKSKEMMNGHKADYFVLQLSFLGWEILGIFTLGILYFWLIPYMQVTIANFYNELKKTNN